MYLQLKFLWVKPCGCHNNELCIAGVAIVEWNVWTSLPWFLVFSSWQSPEQTRDIIWLNNLVYHWLLPIFFLPGKIQVKYHSDHYFIVRCLFCKHPGQQLTILSKMAPEIVFMSFKLIMYGLVAKSASQLIVILPSVSLQQTLWFWLSTFTTWC